MMAVQRRCPLAVVMALACGGRRRPTDPDLGPRGPIWVRAGLLGAVVGYPPVALASSSRQGRWLLCRDCCSVAAELHGPVLGSAGHLVWCASAAMPGLLPPKPVEVVPSLVVAVMSVRSEERRVGKECRL